MSSNKTYKIGCIPPSGFNNYVNGIKLIDFTKLIKQFPPSHMLTNEVIAHKKTFYCIITLIIFNRFLYYIISFDIIDL